MKRICFLLITIIMLMTLFFTVPVSATAKTFEKAEENLATGKVTIVGNAGLDYIGRYVLLNVLNPGNTMANVATAGALNWSDQTIVGKDGKFTFDYTMTGDTGEYNIFASVDTMSEHFEGTLSFASIGDIDSIWTDIKGEIDSSKTDTEKASAIKAIIDASTGSYLNKDLIRLDMTAFQALPTPEYKDNVYLGIAKAKGITELEKFKEQFATSVKVQELNNTAESEYKEKLFGLKNSDTTIDTIFSALSVGQQNEIISVMADATYYLLSDVMSDYEEKVILSKANENGLLWAGMYELLDKTEDYIGIDFSLCRNSSQKSNIIKQLLNKSYTNLGEIKTAYETALPPNGGGGGGGGGGGSSSSGGNNNNTINNTEYTVGNGYFEAQEKVNMFSDIKSVEWAKDSIEALSKKDIVKGYENGEFRPNGAVTRAEFTAMVVRAFALTGNKITNNFKDVGMQDWYYNLVMVGFANGVITGDEDGNFCPNDQISRQDIATILYRVIPDAEKLSSVNLNFYDKNLIEEYAIEAVSALNSSKIISGYDDGTFRPNSFATRAEAAHLLYNTMKFCNIQ